ncbi:arginine--tRNA ligase [Actinopolymorpha alba]|uniref:arginine--tRNA ligase n=1 Tax=Actinopolymorpha alba TaxID=533267 RepID=UPI000379D34A|nr:arginine--tRNA ligase [Actinopolymorpha alba]
MTDLADLLTYRLARAFAEVAGEAADPAVRRSEHADYQADGALRLAKRLRRPPREVAAAVLGVAELDDLVAKAEIAGPGFLNLTIADSALSRHVEAMAVDERLGVPTVAAPERILVDYSGPNVGKELHVGHLRSTVIGDALARLLQFLGHDVVRQNHLGDWGTTFGMLIEHFVDSGADPSADDFALGDLTEFYQAARRKFDGDEDFANRARRRVVQLQTGDADTLALWQLFIDESAKHFQAVYDALDITLTPEHIRGESAYNDGLPGLVDELVKLGLLKESDGALCLFPDGFTGRDGKPFPIIVRKRDGGYNYEATDLVAIRQRLLDLKAQRICYVVASEQRLRLAMLFEAARDTGWLQPPASAEHITFGMVLGPDRKRLRTRSGDLPKLADLLEAAVRRAEGVIAEKAPDLDTGERAAVAKAVGIGAIKYGDLSSDRIKDYLFDLDQMVSFDGNTAPYLQYAHARIQSVFRRGNIDPAAFHGTEVILNDPTEHRLALRLSEFGGVLNKAADGVELHRICGYLFDLATAFTAFYENCPVLRAEDDTTRASRLVLCDVTAKVLATGLSVLGIAAPNRI